MALGDETSTEFSLSWGNDNEKPVNPSPGQVWLSVDIEKFFISYGGGTWEDASPITADENGILYFNGSAITAEPETAIAEIRNGTTVYDSANNVKITFDLSAISIPSAISFIAKCSHAWGGNGKLYVDGELVESKNAAGTVWTSSPLTFRKKPQSVVFETTRSSSIITYSGYFSGKTLSALKVTL